MLEGKGEGGSQLAFSNIVVALLLLPASFEAGVCLQQHKLCGRHVFVRASSTSQNYQAGLRLHYGCVRCVCSERASQHTL
jgi:hypothetical protein